MIYLDNAATSFPKPESVYRKMDEFYRKWGANPGRSGHKMAVTASQAVENVRRQFAGFFHAPGPEYTIFTYNATDASNMALNGMLRPGDEVITTILDHNSISRPLNRLSKERGIRIIRIEPDGEQIDPEKIKKLITEKTRIIAINHASNVTGWIQDVTKIGKVVRENSNALFLVDAAQTAGLVPLSMQDSMIDILIFTGHKALYGPMGIGGMLISGRVDMPAWRVGGSGFDSESEYHPLKLPYRLEAGTENLQGIVGLGEGLEFIIRQGMDNILSREIYLRNILIEGLKEIANLNIYSSGQSRGLGIVSLKFDNIASIEAAAILDDEFGIAVRPGLQCAPYMHRHLGTFPDGTLRLSLGFFNTEEDILKAIEAVKSISRLPGSF